MPAFFPGKTKNPGNPLIAGARLFPRSATDTDVPDGMSFPGVSYHG